MPDGNCSKTRSRVPPLPSILPPKVRRHHHIIPQPSTRHACRRRRSSSGSYASTMPGSGIRRRKIPYFPPHPRKVHTAVKGCLKYFCHSSKFQYEVSRVRLHLCYFPPPDPSRTSLLRAPHQHRALPRADWDGLKFQYAPLQEK